MNLHAPIWAAGYAITDSQSGFRIYPASLFTKVARIVRMVAWRLLARGLYLQGLYRSFKPG